MHYKRWIPLALAALFVIVALSALSGGGQRQAWMEGYMMGRLSTESNSGAALAPYMLQSGQFGFHHRGFGFGHVIGLGFLAFGVFLIARRSSLHNDFREWREHMRQEAEQWHERRYRPQEDSSELPQSTGEGSAQ